MKLHTNPDSQESHNQHLADVTYFVTHTLWITTLPVTLCWCVVVKWVSMCCAAASIILHRALGFATWSRLLNNHSERCNTHWVCRAALVCWSAGRSRWSVYEIYCVRICIRICIRISVIIYVRICVWICGETAQSKKETSSQCTNIYHSSANIYISICILYWIDAWIREFVIPYVRTYVCSLTILPFYVRYWHESLF